MSPGIFGRLLIIMHHPTVRHVNTCQLYCLCWITLLQIDDCFVCSVRFRGVIIFISVVSLYINGPFTYYVAIDTSHVYSLA